MPIFPGNNPLWYPERVVTDLQQKPVKPKGYLTAYRKNGARISDRRADYPSATWMRNSYAKRQLFNCNQTFLVLQSSDGYWHLYDAKSLKYIRRLQGPAGDNAEVQWDRQLPNILYYGEVNGGTHIYKLDVTTNTHTVQYDFTADVRAFYPTANHCWSGSEGSPGCGALSLCGKLWGFKVEDAGFNCLGYVVLNIANQTITWHMDNTSGSRPDFVTLSPSGRYFITSDYPGTFAYPLDGSPRKTLHTTVEHADSVALPNGHDAWITIDYTSGNMFWVDIDDPNLEHHVFDHAYNNPFYGSNYAWHFSGRATAKPGFAVCSNLGSPPCNMYILDMLQNKKYPFAANYALRAQYFDEPHACPSPDLTSVVHNDNYGVTGDIDAYITYIPPLT